MANQKRRRRPKGTHCKRMQSKLNGFQRKDKDEAAEKRVQRLEISDVKPQQPAQVMKLRAQRPTVANNAHNVQHRLNSSPHSSNIATRTNRSSKKNFPKMLMKLNRILPIKESDDSRFYLIYVTIGEKGPRKAIRMKVTKTTAEARKFFGLTKSHQCISVVPHESEKVEAYKCHGKEDMMRHLRPYLKKMGFSLTVPSIKRQWSGAVIAINEQAFTEYDWKYFSIYAATKQPMKYVAVPAGNPSQAGTGYLMVVEHQTASDEWVPAEKYLSSWAKTQNFTIGPRVQIPFDGSRLNRERVSALKKCLKGQYLLEEKLPEWLEKELTKRNLL